LTQLHEITKNLISHLKHSVVDITGSALNISTAENSITSSVNVLETVKPNKYSIFNEGKWER
jgi:hypothetical protein